MQVLGIDHIVLRVSNLELMVDFYSRVLGCAVDHRQDAIGLVHLRAGTSLIDLVDIAGPLGGTHEPQAAGRANMDHLCLRLANFDLDAVRRELLAHGVELGEQGQRYGSTGEGMSIYLRDPEGNGLELRG